MLNLASQTFSPSKTSIQIEFPTVATYPFNTLQVPSAQKTTENLNIYIYTEKLAESETQIVGDLSAKGNGSRNNNNKSDEKEEQAGELGKLFVYGQV